MGGLCGSAQVVCAGASPAGVALGGQGSPPHRAAVLPLIGRHWTQLCGAIVQARAVPLDGLACAVRLSRQGVSGCAAEVVLFGLWLW